MAAPPSWMLRLPSIIADLKSLSAPAHPSWIGPKPNDLSLTHSAKQMSRQMAKRRVAVLSGICKILVRSLRSKRIRHKDAGGVRVAADYGPEYVFFVQVETGVMRCRKGYG
jgi:hypothetical protein